MSYCINPHCHKADHPSNSKSKYCHSCGTSLVLNSRYRVQKPLTNTEVAASGFGFIYEIAEGLQSKILKELLYDYNNEPAVELFQQEANVLKQLSSAGIPEIDGYFVHRTKDGKSLHCIVMEKIDGVPLKQWMLQQRNERISETKVRVSQSQGLSRRDLLLLLAGSSFAAVIGCENLKPKPHSQDLTGWWHLVVVIPSGEPYAGTYVTELNIQETSGRLSGSSVWSNSARSNYFGQKRDSYGALRYRQVHLERVDDTGFRGTFDGQVSSDGLTMKGTGKNDPSAPGGNAAAYSWIARKR